MFTRATHAFQSFLADSKSFSRKLGSARGDAASSARAVEAKDAAEEVASVKAQRAKSAEFDLEMAKAALAEERSRLKLQSVELANRDAQLTELNDQRVGTSARFRRGLARELERRIASLEYELSLAPDAPLSNSAARGAIGHDLRVLRAQLCEVAGTLRPANAEPHFFGTV